MNLQNEIQDELKQVAPHLALLQKNHPFIVPENYFEGMEIKLISSINKLAKDSEAILSISNEHPFNVPNNYFDELHSTILSKIKNENSDDGKIRTIFPSTKKIGGYKLWLAAASVAAATIVSTALFMKHHSNEIASSGTTTEKVASDLLYASEVDDAMVEELYLQDQQANSSSDNVTGENNFLRDVTDIDPNSITEM